jgi:hypothetical protein
LVLVASVGGSVEDHLDSSAVWEEWPDWDIRIRIIRTICIRRTSRHTRFCKEQAEWREGTIPSRLRMHMQLRNTRPRDTASRTWGHRCSNCSLSSSSSCNNSSSWPWQ